MDHPLLFDFTVDKAACTVLIRRQFAAELALVWDAFTQQELLDEWWAPKPFVSRTKHMDFKVGGRRFYAMRSPEGQEHWGVQAYTAISPKTNFQFRSSFADEHENLNTALPSSEWNLDFSEADGVTTVRILIKHETLANLERLIQMGFKEGFTMTLNFLETLLAR